VARVHLDIAGAAGDCQRHPHPAVRRQVALDARAAVPPRLLTNGLELNVAATALPLARRRDDVSQLLLGPTTQQVEGQLRVDWMTVCVTGGAGLIGSHVAEALLAAGHRVIMVDDLSTGCREKIPQGSAFHACDIRSAETARLLREEKIDVLVHHAAQIDVRQSLGS